MPHPSFPSPLIRWLALASLLSGCILTRVVHAPSAPGATDIRDRHVHSGVYACSPPNAIWLGWGPDSPNSQTWQGLGRPYSPDGPKAPIYLSIEAHPLRTKLVSGFLILPLFLIPAHRHYKGMPDQLLLTIEVGEEQFTTLQPDSLQIEWEGRLIPPQAVYYDSTALVNLAISAGQARHLPAQQRPQAHPQLPYYPRTNRLDVSFPIPAGDVKTFTLRLTGFQRAGGPLSLPEVRFERARQWMSAIGP